MTRPASIPVIAVRRARVASLALRAVLVAAMTCASSPVSAARLEYHGRVLPHRQAQAACAPALSSPGDSLALDRGLAAVVARLQEMGYLDARANARWQDGSTLRLDVAEGPRYRLAPVAVRAASAEDSTWIAGSLGLAPGTPAGPGAIGTAIDRAVLAAAQRGHPYASITLIDWEPDSAANLRVTLAGSLGPPVTLSGLRVEGLRTTRVSFVERAAGPVAGTPYRPELGDEVRERLEALELFRKVGPASLEGDGDPGRATLVIPVEEAGYTAFEGAVGVQSQGRVIGQARVQLDNLAGTGRTLGADWESRGPGAARFAARAAEPQVFGWPLRLEGGIEQELQDSLYTRTRWGLRTRVGVGASQRLELGLDQERVVQEHGVVAEASSQITSFALEHAAVDSRFAPRRGLWARLGAAQSFTREHRRPFGGDTTATDAEARSSSAEAGFSWHRMVTPSSGVAIGLESAGRWSDRPYLPLYDRYPLGGAQRLRGYDEDQFRVDRYALARLEWRRFLDESGTFAFLFWDQAMTQTRIDDGASGRIERRSHAGYGLGVQLGTGVGRVGLTYGVAAARPAYEGRIHLRLVTAF